MIGLSAAAGDDVEQLHSGLVFLSVPLIGDVIQVGAVGTLVTGTIEVAKTPSAMVVRRTDGTPLQAEIIEQRGGTVVRMPVFTEPVDALRLWRMPDAVDSHWWALSPTGRIRRHRDLVQLVETITTFALAKQRRPIPAGLAGG